MNDLLWNNKRAWATSTLQAPAQCVIDGMVTYSVVVTQAGSAITAPGGSGSPSVVDYTDVLNAGVQANDCIGPVVIESNDFYDCQTPIQVARCTGPQVLTNHIWGHHPTVAEPRALYGQGNTRSRWVGNTYQVSPTTTEQNTLRRMEIVDHDADIRDNVGFTTDNSFMLLEYSGGVGLAEVPVTPPRGRALLWYGDDIYTASTIRPLTEARSLTDGDTVVLNNVKNGVSRTYAYKRTSPNSASREFNTQNTDAIGFVGLMGLINADGQFTATKGKRMNGTASTRTYDCIILTQTLQLIDDLGAAIAECSRILRPGGVLLKLS